MNNENPERPLIWIDDEVGYYQEYHKDYQEKYREFWMNRKLALYVQPDVYVGLTQFHLDQIDLFMKDPIEYESNNYPKFLN